MPLSGDKTATAWPSCSSAATVRCSVVTTPLTCGDQASVTIAIFMADPKM